MYKFFNKLNILIFVSVSFIFLFLSIYMFLDKITNQTYNNMFYSLVYFCFFISFLFIFLSRLNYFYILGLFFLYVGGFLCWKYNISIKAFIYYFLFGIFWATGYIYDRYKSERQEKIIENIYCQYYGPS